jgi:2-haloacid dehalogenase
MIGRLGIRACMFDAYGTLFDVSNTAVDLEAQTGISSKVFSDLWRSKQLQYSWVRSLTGQHTDFWRVTLDALDFALSTFGLSDTSLRAQMMDSYLHLPVFPDVVSTLEQLRSRGLRLAILSNGSPRMLDSALANARIAEHFDTVISVEEVGIFKPHSKVYALGTERLGSRTVDLCFVSSNGWDAWSAKAFGFRVVWCNRSGQPSECLPSAPDAEVTDLRELASWMGPA